MLGSAWSASQSSTPRAPLDEKAFTENGTKCGSQGAGGKDCWPFHRYDEKALKKENPIFNKCCTPCMEKFSGDLSLLEIPNHVKRKVMKRFERYHEHFYKVNAPSTHVRDRGHGQGHTDANKSERSSIVPEMSLLETSLDHSLNLESDKSGEWLVLRSKEIFSFVYRIKCCGT